MPMAPPCDQPSTVSNAQRKMQTSDPKCPTSIFKNIPSKQLFYPLVAWQKSKTKIIVVTYGDDLSTTLARTTKKVLVSSTYKNIFPHTILENDKMQATRLRTEKGGHVIFTSIHGSMTGLGADWIILDDPLQAAHMRSEIRQDDLIQVFRQSITTRLNHLEKGKMLLIQQRISPNDLCGALTKDPNHNWNILSLPARFDAPAEFNLGLFGTKKSKQVSYLHLIGYLKSCFKRRKQKWVMLLFAHSICNDPFLKVNVR